MANAKNNVVSTIQTSEALEPIIEEEQQLETSPLSPKRLNNAASTIQTSETLEPIIEEEQQQETSPLSPKKLNTPPHSPNPNKPHSPKERETLPLSPKSKHVISQGALGYGYYPEYERQPPASPNTKPVFSRRTSGWGYYPDYERPPSTFPLSNRKLPTDAEKAAEVRYWYRATSNFLPIWFTVTIGSGTVPTIIQTQALQFPGLSILVYLLFALNIFIFLLFTILTLLRYIIWPAKFKEMLQDPVDSLFIGTFPMGLATLINLSVLMVVPRTGTTFVTFLWVLWWSVAVLSVGCMLYVSFRVTTTHPTTLQTITAASLLPILPGLVSASTGGLVASILTDDNRALTTILASYILLGLSFPLGFMVAGLYFARLVLYKLPERAAIPSTFLPVALSAQSSLSFIQLGKVAEVVVARTGFLGGQIIGEVWYGGGVVIALVLWGFAVVWLVWATASLFERKVYFFSIGWWAFTFPIGFLASSTIALGQEFGSVVFNALGSLLTLAVMVIWAIVFVKTVKSFISAEFFQ